MNLDRSQEEPIVKVLRERRAELAQLKNAFGTITSKEEKLSNLRAQKNILDRITTIGQVTNQESMYLQRLAEEILRLMNS